MSDENRYAIEITSIDKSSLELVANGTELGYKVHFRCSLTAGYAVLVPITGGEFALEVGNYISVEPGQESISDFVILSANSPHRMVPLLQPGDYSITGTVVLNGDNEVFWVEAGTSFSFCLTIDDTRGLEPQKGQDVSFTVHGLALYDEGDNHGGNLAVPR